MGYYLARKFRKHDLSLLQSKKTIVNAFRFGVTVKPVLTATSEQRPPVNNDQPESTALLKLQFIYLVFWTNL